MAEKVRIEGFHSTTQRYADMIKKTGKFKPSTKDNEWLGKGVYFWSEYIDALFWVERSYKEENEMCIITATISEDEKRILDLDVSENMKKLNDFATTFNEEIKEKKFSLNFKNEKEMRCFYCESFKRKYNINVIIYSFPINGHNKAGFDLRRKQICVDDADSIFIKKYENVRKGDYNVI